MSELPEGIAPAAEPVPVDSASGIVLRRGTDGRVEVLLGRRARGSSFMPGYEVFPGGALEDADEPGAPGGLSRCVAREVREESGLEIPVDAWIDAGERTTPPMFPRRFRNRFFVAAVPASEGDEGLVPAEAEFDRLGFRAPESVLALWEVGRVRIPPPVLPILRLLAHGADERPVDLAARIAEANALEERAPRIEFIPGIWMLPVRTATLPPATHTNVWLPGTSSFAIVDPGATEPEEVARLDAVIERRREAGGEPSAVLLTHRHRDHAAGAPRLAARLGVPLRAHPVALEALEVSGPDAQGDDPPRLVPIEDGERLRLGNVSLRAVHTPGHAPGHLAFLVEEQGALIAGDLISGLSTILIDPELGDMGEYLESLRRARDLQPVQLLPGHGPPLPARALERLIDHRERREQRVLDQVGSRPTELGAIASESYDDVPEMPAALTRRQALSHLLHLQRRGRVNPVDASLSRWTRCEEPA
jgi:glyoxylase-like metal-dependent hydrolase (beta-lactamase superfamily II)/8-oxo-dGTP pyrophosphatase MutT (NUDIX family)